MEQLFLTKSRSGGDPLGNQRKCVGIAGCRQIFFFFFNSMLVMQFLTQCGGANFSEEFREERERRSLQSRLVVSPFIHRLIPSKDGRLPTHTTRRERAGNPLVGRRTNCTSRGSLTVKISRITYYGRLIWNARFVSFCR